mmetsp:Transcript_94628/g.304567  ORF Transcript_94628/g.304567 Transcript_94628/m.304567 type:complete len:207 (+) Transcript_94628:522-1142(+)
MGGATPLQQRLTTTKASKPLNPLFQLKATAANCSAFKAAAAQRTHGSPESSPTTLSPEAVTDATMSAALAANHSARSVSHRPTHLGNPSAPQSTSAKSPRKLRGPQREVVKSKAPPSLSEKASCSSDFPKVLNEGGSSPHETNKGRAAASTCTPTDDALHNSAANNSDADAVRAPTSNAIVGRETTERRASDEFADGISRHIWRAV